MPVRVHRITPRPDNFLIGARRGRQMGKLFADGAAGDRHAFAVQQAMLLQHAQHLRYAARAMEIDGDEAPRGLEIADHRHALANALEIVDGPLHFGRRCNGEEMQHRIGRAAGGHHQRDRILDRLPGDDVAGTDILFHRVYQHARRVACRISFLGIGGSHLRRAEQAHPKRLERRRHGVGRVLAAAGADGRTGVALDAVVILLRHLAGGISAHRFER